MSTYQRLTRRDLAGFDNDTTALVLDAIDRGAVGRVSSRGHAVLRGPDGRSTASVSPKTIGANRSIQNARSGVAKLFPHTPTGEAMADALDRRDTPMTPPRTKKTAPDPAPAPAAFACPECGKAFPTALARRGHVTGAHRAGGPTPCPECGRTFSSRTAMRNHESVTHGRVASARAGQRRRRAAAREAVGGPPMARRSGDAAPAAFACPECGREYTTMTNAVRHMRDIHRIDKGEPVAVTHRRTPVRKPPATAPNAPTADPGTIPAPAPVEAPTAPVEAPTAPVEAPTAPVEASAPDVTAPERLAAIQRLVSDPDAARAAIGDFIRDLVDEAARLRDDNARIRAELDDTRARLALIREAMDA